MKNKSLKCIFTALIASVISLFASCGNTIFPAVNDEEPVSVIPQIVDGEEQTEAKQMAYFTISFGDKVISKARKVNPNYDFEIQFDLLDYELWAGKIVDGEAQTQTVVTAFNSNSKQGSLEVGTYSFTLKAGTKTDTGFTTQYIATIEEQELVAGDVNQNGLYFFFSPAGETGTLKYTLNYRDYSSIYTVTPSAKYVKYAERNSSSYTAVTPNPTETEDDMCKTLFEVPLDPGLYKFYFTLTNSVTDASGEVIDSKDTIWSEIVKIEGGFDSEGEHDFENINLVVQKPTNVSAYFTLNTIEVTDIYQLNVSAETPSQDGWLTFQCYASTEQITDLENDLKRPFILKDIEFESGEKTEGAANQFTWKKEATSPIGTYYYYVAVKNHFSNPFTELEMVSEPVYFEVADPLVVTEQQAHFGLSLNQASFTVPDVVDITLGAELIEKTNFVVMRPAIQWLNGENEITGTSWEIGDGSIEISTLLADITNDQLTKLGVTTDEYDIILDTSKIRLAGYGISDEITITFNLDVEIDGEPDSFDARFTCILSDQMSSGSSGSDPSNIDEFTFWHSPQETELWVILEEDPEFASGVSQYLIYVADSEDSTNKIVNGEVVTDNKFVLLYSSLESGHTYSFSINAVDADGELISARSNEWTYESNVSLSFDVNVDGEQLVILPEPGAGVVNLDHYTYSFLDVDENIEAASGIDEGGSCRIELAELTENHNYIITLKALDSEGNIIVEAIKNWKYGPGGYDFPYDISFTVATDEGTQCLVITPIVDNDEFESKFYVYDIIIEDKYTGNEVHNDRYTWSTTKSVSIELSNFESGKTYTIKLPAWDNAPEQLAYAVQEYVHN